MPIAPVFCGSGFYCSEKEAHVMRKGDAVSGIAITLLGFGVVVYTLAENTMRFNAQTSDGVPGAGFFPVLLGTVLGILGVVLLIRSILEKGGRTPPSGSREETRKNIKMLLFTISLCFSFCGSLRNYLFCGRSRLSFFSILYSSVRGNSISSIRSCLSRLFTWLSS